MARYYGVPVEQLRGKARDRQIVLPRQVAMYLMREETEAPLLRIGEALGGRDHSTVLHGCDKIEREMA
ncbi:MAG: helix-turn-helix domain-containing protein, partial [Candidatus Limnocylindria bacterium]